MVHCPISVPLYLQHCCIKNNLKIFNLFCLYRIYTIYLYIDSQLNKTQNEKVTQEISTGRFSLNSTGNYWSYLFTFKLNTK